MTIALAIICVILFVALGYCWHFLVKAEEDRQKAVAKAECLDVRCTVLEREKEKLIQEFDEACEEGHDRLEDN